MFFPLVVLVAVLPGMAALNSWDLTPPGPMWGLRGLAVLDGFVFDQTPAAATIKPIQEAAAFRVVAYQPPLYAWMEAIAFALSTNRNPIGSILPSYLSGIIVVSLVYLHGGLWRGAGLGLSAAILVGFNHSLLSRMQEATPATLGLCGVLAALLAYGWHERLIAESGGTPWWAGPSFWALLGGLSLGIALLSSSGLPLIVIPIILLHQYYLRGGFTPSSRRTDHSSWWSGHRLSAGFLDGLLALAVALAISLPWFVFMIKSHGWNVVAALAFPPFEIISSQQMNLLQRLIVLAPVTLPIGLFGAARAIRSALADGFDTLETMGGSLWVIWLAVASLTPAIWTSGPQSSFDLLLLVPLNLLAAQTIADFVNRRVKVSALVGLVPATILCIALWASTDLRIAVSNLIHGRADAATALGLHLVLDVIVISLLVIRWLNRWARATTAGSD